MGKKSPSPPPAPDYAAAAQEQGKANIDASRVGAALNRVDEVNPWGTLNYSQDPTNKDHWTKTTTLSPDQQRLLDLQSQGQIALGQTATAGLDRVKNANGTPFDMSGLPGRVNSVGGANYGMYGGNTAAPVSSLDFSGLGAVPGKDDFAAQGKDVQDALYRRSTAQLDPQYKQAEEAERARLANSGVSQGSEAFDTAMNDFNRQRQSDYGDARDRSILASGTEQSRLNSDSLASRAQMMSQILAGGTFQNEASQQSIDNALKSLGFNNTAKSQTLNDNIARGNFQNANRGAGIDEQAYLRQLPLNEFNALMSGAQIDKPNFSGAPSVAGPAAAPVFAGAQAQGQSAMDLYNQQMAGSNANGAGITGLVGSLGGAAMMAF